MIDMVVGAPALAELRPVYTVINQVSSSLLSATIFGSPTFSLPLSKTFSCNFFQLFIIFLKSNLLPPSHHLNNPKLRISHLPLSYFAKAFKD